MTSKTDGIIWISPSQVATFLECPRKWWFQSAMKMPDAKIDPTAFNYGNTLHEVAERFLRADDQGRDESGQPVDLYPAGWDKKVQRAEAIQIKDRIEKAIEKGVLRRLPNRNVETWFKIPVVDDIWMRGLMDQDNEEICEDHKSTSSRRWAMGKTKLSKDSKMLCYAWVQWTRYGNDPIRLRLNYFNKDHGDDGVWEVTAPIPAKDVEEFWTDEVVPAALDMAQYKILGDGDWQTVEGPRVRGICEKYKGCPFAEICGHMLTPAQFRTQQELLLKPRSERIKETTMSIIKRRRKINPVTPVVEAAPVPEVDPNTAPWANPECAACKGTGISSKGKPCRACDVVAERTGGTPSTNFDVWEEEGALKWGEKGTGPVVEKPAKKKASKKASKKTKTPKEDREDVEVERAAIGGRGLPTQAAEIADEEPSVVEIDAAKTASGEGFTLFINCFPHGMETVDLATLLNTEMAELAKVKGVDSYYELNSFDRRDMLAQAVPEVARGLAGKSVVCLGAGQELKSYIDALRPHAAMVVTGTF